MDDPRAEAVQKANQGFYDAFSGLDIIEMSRAWLQDGSVKCIHPGWALLTGWEDVMRSWERIFDNATMMQFAITDLEITVEGDWAWVTCTENITFVDDARVAEGRVQATNMYKFHDSKWLMVHHHGSPVMQGT